MCGQKLDFNVLNLKMKAGKIVLKQPFWVSQNQHFILRFLTKKPKKNNIGVAISNDPEVFKFESF